MRTRRLPALAAIALAVVLLSGVPTLAAPAGAASAGASPVGHGAAPALHATGAAPRPTAGPGSSGRGIFFENTLVPNASASSVTCFGGLCSNVSNDPSINRTSYGTLAVAFTAFTNDSPCAAATPYAESEVGVVVSTTGGSSWSATTYLGAPSGCSPSVAAAEPDAWQPSLTSLANGTLVLVYVAFNATAPLYALQYGPGAFSVTTDRLLLTESYNNGTSWTSPTVLNVSDNPSLTASSFTAVRPWVTANGTDVYVTWTNLTASPGLAGGSPAGSAGVQLLVSTDGGTTWPSTPTALPVVPGGTGLQVAMNPNALVLPNGTLVVAYATNFTYTGQYDCMNSTCIDGVWTSSVVAAWSTNQGSSFTLATIDPDAIAAPTASTIPRAFDAFFDPSPELAYGGPYGVLGVAFSAGTVGTVCTTGLCTPWVDDQAIFIDASTNGGASWGTAHPAMPSLNAYGPLFGTYYPSESYNPALAINASGTFDLAFTFVNFTLCNATAAYGTNCGPEQELFGESVDNGTSFSDPVLVSGDWEWQYNNPTNPDGNYATALVAGGELWLAWTTAGCPGWGSAAFYLCGYPGSGGQSDVVISSLFLGAGVTLTFSESGLPSGLNWTVDVQGNERLATTPTPLVVTGVPAGVSISWVLLTALPAGYGNRYGGTPSLTSPATLTSPTTVTVAYAREVLVNIESTPAFPTPATVVGYSYYAYCPGDPTPVWNDPACPSTNWNITGAFGAQWVTPGTALSLGVDPIGSYYCGPGLTCYETTVLNLSFVSWTGTGAGSVNTTAGNTTLTANGPVNETANFLMNGWCEVYFPPFYTYSATCLATTANLTFEESGLPNGTAWSVTTTNGAGNTTSWTNTTPWILAPGAPTGTPTSFLVWTVPASGGYWVPTTVPATSLLPPIPALVLVNFTFVASLAGLSFPVSVSTVGLPNGLPWSVTLNTTYGVASGNATELSIASGSYNASGGAVEATNGTEYVVTSVDFQGFEQNHSGWSNGSAPRSVTLRGPAQVVLVYAPRYWLDVAATTGGSAGPGGAWYAPDAAVILSESAAVGFHFTAWSGSGNGATGGSQDSQTAPTIHVYGPISELANFVRNSSAGDTVSVTEFGLPGAGAFSFTLGAQGYAGNGTASAAGLANGSYAFSAETASSLAAGQLGMVANWSSSYVTNPNGTLAIDGDGTISVNYTVVDNVTTSAVGDGTITPGSGWFASGSVLTVNVTAATGWLFEGLTTSLPTTPLTPTSFHVSVNAPASIVAEFTLAPTPTAPTYTLAIDETGIPAGVSWNVSLTLDGTPVQGATGTASSVSVPGLVAGSYTVSFEIAYAGAGTRYVPTGTGSESVTLPTVGSVSATFDPEYNITVIAGVGGTAGPGSQWVAAGANVTLSAAPNATSLFEGWTGAGTGSYTGSSAGPTVQVNGPITETAGFAPMPTASTTTTTSGSTFPTLGVALLVVLLAVGAVVGLLLARRGRPPAPSEPAEESGGEIYGATAPAADDAGSAAPPEESPPS